MKNVFYFCLIFLYTTLTYSQQTLTDSLLFSFEGKKSYDCVGKKVARLGDVNKDGYNDVIFGSIRAEEVYVFFGGENPGDSVVVFKNDEDEMDYGSSLSYVGDIDGDGFDDVIVGSMYNDNLYGNVFVYFGGTELDTAANYILCGVDYYGFFGYHLTGADVNGDGYSDIVVGSSRNSKEAIYIYKGSRTFETTPWKSFQGAEDEAMVIANAGDFNGDGYQDILVGSPDEKVNGNNYMGRVYLYLGGAEMNGDCDACFNGHFANEEFGAAVAGLGDVNGDGFDDIIVGTEYNGSSGPDTAYVYVYFGGSEIDTTADIIFREAAGYAVNYGTSVAYAGDLNNDGFNDIMVGAPDANAGEVYIYFGGEEIENSPDIILQGEFSGDGFGQSMEALGDMNGDGFPEIAVGAPDYSGEGGNHTGKAYVYSIKNNTSAVENFETVNKFALLQNYPNPFNPTTTISYSIPTRSTTARKQSVVNVILTVHNALGQKITTLVNKKQNPGTHSVRFDASDLPSGVYFYRLTAGDFSDTKKMILIK